MGWFLPGLNAHRSTMIIGLFETIQIAQIGLCFYCVVGMQFMDFIPSDNQLDPVPADSPIFGEVVFTAALLLVSPLLLTFGAAKGNRWLLLPWMVFCVVRAIALGYFIFSLHGRFYLFAEIIFAVALYGETVYAIFVVLSSFILLGRSNSHRAELKCTTKGMIWLLVFAFLLRAMEGILNFLGGQFPIGFFELVVVAAFIAEIILALYLAISCFGGGCEATPEISISDQEERTKNGMKWLHLIVWAHVVVGTLLYIVLVCSRQYNLEIFVCVFVLYVEALFILHLVVGKCLPIRNIESAFEMGTIEENRPLPEHRAYN